MARKVGVSTALVSYVLNGKAEQARVGKEMAEKISKVAREMNYQPNLIARGLKDGRTKTIGLIVADISNAFFSSLARIIEDEAKQHGYTVIFGSSDEQPGKMADLITALLNRQVDGMIIAPVEHGDAQIQELRRKGISFVLVDRYYHKINTNRVTINNHEASFNAVKLLIKNGYKKPGMLAYDNSLPHMQERIRGYEQALKEAHIRRKPEWLARIPYATANTDMESLLSNLLRGPNAPDALFFATNSLAVQGLKIINRMGIRVPQELGLISFDEHDAFDFFYSPVTYVSQNLLAIGQETVRMLISQIEDGKKSEPVQLEIPAKLVKRESCGSKPAGKKK
ncbi:LacI family DNA-binding transcriptional regulator [Pseudobacter ginsenosidimutans]|uniref:LacI family DNA-binding transcriptional regulator n=1 Tax=Pseudobacter ginsenosidimutans TaxID=661488 RepID=UPI001CEFA6FC|nr:substrate-binding domain-containing protein [Pseudobacter ginsenosidimutans]